MTRGSPPCRSMIARNRSSACARIERACGTWPRRRRDRAPRRATTSIRSLSSSEFSIEIRPARCPSSSSMHSIDFVRVADRAADRPVHGGDDRLRLDAGTPCRSRRATRRARGRRRVVFMNAPLPLFTSSTSASMPSAIFLLMIDAEISGMLSIVPVTSRRA